MNQSVQNNFNSYVGGSLRDSIPGHDPGRAVYESHGRDRLITFVVYYSIKLLYIVGAIYCVVEIPWVFLGFFMLTYFLENTMMFPTMHTLYHALFIEQKESKMTPGQHYAYVHHYRDPRLFPKIWVDYRLQYVWNRENKFAWTNFLTLYGILAASVLLVFVSPAMSACFFASFMMCALFQGLAHEWYHCTNKKEFYSSFTYYTMQLLEKVKIIDSEKHKSHHKHNLKNLKEVDQWVDVWSPFAEGFARYLWKQALSRYVPGERKMVRYLALRGIMAVSLKLVILTALAYVIGAKLL